MSGAVAAIVGPEEGNGGRARARRTPERVAEWSGLAQRLAQSLGCLEEGHFLILETRGESPYYVQFAAEGAGGMHAEAVSDRFLEPWQRLDATAQARLRRLGWRPPTDIGDGPPNWWRAFDAPVPTVEVAELAVETLRTAFDVARPAALLYRAFSRDREEILLPTLGLDHVARPAPLADRMDTALRKYLGVDEIVYDAEGDAPIRHGDVMVFARAHEERGYVAFFSPVLLAVTKTSALLDAVNDINDEIRMARALVTCDTVIIAAEAPDGPHLSESMVKAYEAVSSLADFYAGKLRARFGGATFFEEPTSPETTTGCGLYL